MNTRISTQARAVLKVLQDKRCHLTADEILESVSSIGTATVYRALDHLTELGMIRRLALGKKSAVYEYIRESHMHFVCSCCHAIIDIPAVSPGSQIQSQVSQQYGFTVDHHDLTVYGRCAECMKEKIS